MTIDDSLYLPGIAPFSPRRQAPEPEEDEDELPDLPPDAEITLKLDNLDRDDGMVLITALGDRAGAWAAAQGTLLGSRWEHGDGLPYALVMDDVDLPKQIQREHPEVRIDIVEYAPRTREELIRMEARSVQQAPSAAASPEPAAAQSPLEVGPGGLVWDPIQDQGIDGAAARWLDGQFKVLHAAGRQHALFYGYDHGGYVHIACGGSRCQQLLRGRAPWARRRRNWRARCRRNSPTLRQSWSP